MKRRVHRVRCSVYTRDEHDAFGQCRRGGACQPRGAVEDEASADRVASVPRRPRERVPRKMPAETASTTMFPHNAPLQPARRKGAIRAAIVVVLGIFIVCNIFDLGCAM